jgi:hypothetical protein
MQLTEDNVADYAHTLIERVSTGGHLLDYSETSLIVLENLIRRSDNALQSPELPVAHRDIAVFYNGCYLGEVLSRNLGGVWHFESPWPDTSLVFRRNDGTGLQVFPFQKLFRRIAEGPEHNDLVDYYNGIKEYLADTTKNAV